MASLVLDASAVVRIIEGAEPSTIRQPTCRSTGTTTAQIQALPLEQLHALAIGEAFCAGAALIACVGPAGLPPDWPPHLVSAAPAI